MSISRLLSLIVLTALLSACGQKGPLILPPDDSQPTQGTGKPVSTKPAAKKQLSGKQLSTKPIASEQIETKPMSTKPYTIE